MTQREAICALKALRVYCQPEHRLAVERAILALIREERQKEK